MDLVELLQREIQGWKEKWAKLKEENVNLKGFRAMVMEEPKKYSKQGMVHNVPPSEVEEQHNPTIFDVARDDFKKELNWKEKYVKEHKLRQEAETETILVKGIGMNSPEMKKAKEKIKELEEALANALAIDESHQKQMGQLQVRLTEVEEENKKLAKHFESQVERTRKAGM